MTENEQKFENYVDNILNKLSAMHPDYIETCEDVKHLLLIKGKEYRRDNNTYHNFEVGALMTGKRPDQVLKGFQLKHKISIQDILNDLKKGIKPVRAVVIEKLNDYIVYEIISMAMRDEQSLQSLVDYFETKITLLNEVA